MLLAGERLAAPKRLRELTPLTLLAFRRPAPFVFLPAGREIADQQPGQRLVPMRIDVAGIPGERGGERGERLVETAQLAQNVGAVVQRVDVCGLEHEHAIEARQRVVEPAERELAGAAVEQRRDIVRRAGERAVEIGHRLVVPGELLQDEAVVALGLGRAGVGPHGCGHELQGLCIIAARKMQLGKQMQHAPVLAPRLRDNGEPPLGLVETALPLQFASEQKRARGLLFRGVGLGGGRMHGKTDLRRPL